MAINGEMIENRDMLDEYSKLEYEQAQGPALKIKRKIKSLLS